LHFHGFDDQQALTGCHGVSRFIRRMIFAGHGRDDLLAPFAARAPWRPRPRARVTIPRAFRWFRAEFLARHPRGGQTADFRANLPSTNGKYVRSDFRCVGFPGASLKRGAPAIVIAVPKFDDAGFLGALRECLARFYFHGAVSSCSRSVGFPIEEGAAAFGSGAIANVVGVPQSACGQSGGGNQSQSRLLLERGSAAEVRRARGCGIRERETIGPR